MDDATFVKPRVSAIWNVEFLVNADGPPMAGIFFDPYAEAKARARCRDLLRASAKVSMSPPAK